MKTDGWRGVEGEFWARKLAEGQTGYLAETTGTSQNHGKNQGKRCKDFDGKEVSLLC